MSDTLTQGQKLERGQSLASNNGAYTLTLQDDGNLVLAARGEALWASATNGQDVTRAELQSDGNFVLYLPDKPVWHTDTQGKKDVRLVLQDDGNLVLYAADGPAWATNTQTDGPPPPAPAPEPGAGGMTAGPGQPVDEPPPEPAGEAPAAPTPRTYTVASGDTMWAIAERFYGDGSRYQVIADASGVADPDLIHPGQVLTIP
ncbi:LysM peptidoglycan-binding domain-containing protein [Mycobacterium sherrisii]|uniref:Lectin n=1 Tax=Mycobacterium sherrisii TaxID=243061 RepID=A0A1E3T5X4_9MYCO|nr:LysM peptidoglycan-binding domain-containing protein [Mycobacterium sherrisii]MCV7029770.1 LysM peptidoglycan-binding domain-containing protein [Mycobacterium sherrisii]MEC4762390.1 LysM peptidoglycan-binding domain-containing protein [Mycobacterium sherrisii]ODR09752.1 lectin [Mycobacterium sherrisii]ORW75047.1 lectin [Mycobacterium sherrisii]